MRNPLRALADRRAARAYERAAARAYARAAEQARLQRVLEEEMEEFTLHVEGALRAAGIDLGSVENDPVVMLPEHEEIAECERCHGSGRVKGGWAGSSARCVDVCPDCLGEGVAE